VVPTLSRCAGHIEDSRNLSLRRISKRQIVVLKRSACGRKLLLESAMDHPSGLYPPKIMMFIRNIFGRGRQLVDEEGERAQSQSCQFGDPKIAIAAIWRRYEQRRMEHAAARLKKMATRNSREYRYRRRLRRISADYRSCGHCGDNMGGRRSDAKFCSDVCRVRSHRESHSRLPS
jgi:NADH pyrophosphatase NudC (nudix superfamily)